MSIIKDVIEERAVRAILDSGVFEKIMKKEWELAKNVEKKKGRR